MLGFDHTLHTPSNGLVLRAGAIPDADSASRICRRSLWIFEANFTLESGLARSYLGGVERGQRNILIVNIGRLAETLKVKLAELLTF
jgi:hypothetical protein